MQISQTNLSGLLVFTPRIFADDRGYFYEIYRYNCDVIPPLVQSNISRSSHGVLRGLHYQQMQTQAKLITVVRGRIYDVAVDLRAGSETFGQWHGLFLDDQEHKQLFVPAGFAHGFCVVSSEADVLYQCSDYYHPQSEVCIRWDDPALGIDWPVAEPSLSPKDAKGFLLGAMPSEKLLMSL